MRSSVRRTSTRIFRSTDSLPHRNEKSVPPLCGDGTLRFGRCRFGRCRLRSPGAMSAEDRCEGTGVPGSGGGQDGLRSRDCDPSDQQPFGPATLRANSFSGLQPFGPTAFGPATSRAGNHSDRTFAGPSMLRTDPFRAGDRRPERRQGPPPPAAAAVTAAR